MKMKQLKTRHALLVSCVSLLTSFAMLLSCTYAWFTDTATSGANRIEAGKFRVEAYHQTWQGTKPNAEVVESDKIEGKTDLFKSALNNNGQSGTGNNGTEYKLWEPGAMAVETFTIKNEGELALKYQFNLVAAALNQVTWSGVSGTYDLRDVIKVAIVSDATEMTGMNSRTNFESLSSDKWKSWTDFVSGATKTGNLLPNNSESFIVAMWWPSTANDNYYNLYARDLGTPSFTYYNCHTNDRLIIDVKTVVSATQNTVEADSFNNQYDYSAYYPAYPTMLYGTGSATYTSGTTTEALTITVKKNGSDDTIGSATVPNAGAAQALNDIKTAKGIAGSSSTYVSDDLELTLNVETTSATETSLTLDVTMDSVFTRSEGTNENTATVTKTVSQPVTNLGDGNAVTVTLNLEPNLQNVSVTHTHGNSDPVAMNPADSLDNLEDGQFYYNANTGELTLMTSKFSEFLIAFTRQTPTNEFAEYLSISSPKDVDILPDGYDKGVKKSDVLNLIAGMSGNEDGNKVAALNSVIHGATYQMVDGLDNSETNEANKLDHLWLENCRQYKANSETAYQELDNGKYQYWHGDFVMKFNKDISAFTNTNTDNTIILCGEYGTWGWLKIPCPVAIEAGKEYRMIHDFMGGGVSVNFMDLCTSVKQFNCGAIYIKENYDDSDPLAMTIEFRMYETKNQSETETNTANEETGKYIIVDRFTYTFKNNNTTNNNTTNNNT